MYGVGTVMGNLGTEKETLSQKQSETYLLEKVLVAPKQVFSVKLDCADGWY